MTYACDPRNRDPGKIIYDVGTQENTYCPSTQIDIRGEDVSQIRIINIIKGFYEQGEPWAQKLLSDENSDVLFYFTGHSGDEFFKVQDAQVLYARDVGIALDIAFTKKRYKRIMFLSDTCEAFSWFSFVQAPNVMYQASSGLGESAYSHGYDTKLKTYTSDKYSYLAINFLKGKFKEYFENMSVKRFFESFDKKFLGASPVHNHTLTNATLQNTPLINFFPPPFTIDSIDQDATKYSIYERIKHKSSEEEFKAAAEFIENLKL